MEIEQAIAIRSYERLEKFVVAFAEGRINLLVIVGSGGLQKSRVVQAHVPTSSCWIQGNASPFGIYLKLFQFRDRLIVIDDVDGLTRDRHGINLLKCLCQTEKTKVVSWLTGTRQLSAEGVPREFETNSRVCIIANEWGRKQDRNLAAVADRGQIVHFVPTREEVHRRTADWFDDPEIYEWFGSRLDRISKPTMRMYVRAKELKLSGLDWKEFCTLSPENPRRNLAIELLADSSFGTQEERAKAFIERGGGCRATFFNYAKRLRDAQV